MENKAATALAQGWRAHLKIHAAAACFPMMSEDELRALGEDIRKNRLQVPIVLSHDGLLVDGRNRLAAMELLELPTDAVSRDRLDSNVDIFAYVVSANLHRRHLSAEQRDDFGPEDLRRMLDERAAA